MGKNGKTNIMCIEKARKIVSGAKIVLLDIEGTTTSISFVKDQLFPYAETHLESYVKANWDSDHMKLIVNSLTNDQDKLKSKEGFIALPSVPTETTKVEEFIDKVISHLKWQQANDLKTFGLKTLQGYIWIKGYQNKEVEGHLYDDVPKAIKLWNEQGKKIYIYSSGSVAAQKLLFEHSKFGNLDSLIHGNFDTAVGSKTESESYCKIVQELNVSSEDIVFFTDRPKEVAAAKLAKMKVIRMERDEPNPYLLEEAEYIGQEDANLKSFLPFLTN